MIKNEHDPADAGFVLFSLFSCSFSPILGQSSVTNLFLCFFLRRRFLQLDLFCTIETLLRKPHEGTEMHFNSHDIFCFVVF
jgi:hypothetical protein